jgi:hypothetical protein
MSDTPIPSSTAAPIDKAQFWAETVAAFTTSGLSVRASCSARGLREKRFYTRRRTLGLNPAARPVTPPPAPARGFVPVRVVADAVAEVALPGGVTLRVPLTADPASVARLAAALRGAAC